MSSARSTVVRALVAALVVTAIAVTTGVLLAAPPPTETPAVPADTAISDLDASSLTIRRASFCEDIGRSDVEAALGGPATGTSSYGNGDRAQLPGTVDVAHEFACTWQAGDGTEAEAWVFAPPIGREQGESLVARASAAKACQATPDTAYGDPSVELVCELGSEYAGKLQVSWRGLFGKSWLSCQLTAPASTTTRDALVARAGDWCVAVASAADRS